jgi:hypothetical protein
LAYIDNGLLTILNAGEDSVKDASALALAALGWVLADEGRAQRLLDLTGLTPDGLRGAIGDVATHRAILDFLAAHEPDLVGAAAALEVSPEQLVAARGELRA